MQPIRAVLSSAIGAGAFLAAVTLAPTAAAAPADSANGPAAYPAATTAAEQRQVVDYWTEDRMKNAVPREKKVDPRAKPGGTSGATAVQVPATPLFGKVFFTEKGTNYVCSGTVTQSANQSVVTTAGHCVNEGPGAYVTNFAFVPKYENGSRPYGTWTAKTLVTTNQWRTSGDFNHDVGFAVMNTNSTKQTLTAAVGGAYPIAFNLGYNLTFDAYGYPAARPYDGQLLWRCSGKAGTDTSGGSTDHRLPCTMTGGSSGGGWITGGKLNSLNSFGYRGEKDVMYGPYFGSVEQSTYTTASSS